MSLDSMQGEVGKQINAIKAIPWTVLSYWGGWFTFSAVRYVENLILPAIPNPGGMAGQIVNAGLRGMTTVVDMVTWDAIKASGPSAMYSS